jgi:hypothetical protein
MITIYKDIYSKEPHYISVETALERIKIGKSKALVDILRAEEDKIKANEIKKTLPCVCFSGTFTERKDECIEKHSGYIVLDFDNVFNPNEKKIELFKKDYVRAVWISPSGTGVKALVRIAEGKKHREHFQALQDIFPDVDKSGINESRVCFESYDIDILVKEAVPFTEVKTIERVREKTTLPDDDKFQRILTWVNKSGGFYKGERNAYIYKLASACCRFGITDNNCLSLIYSYISSGDTDFTKKEIYLTLKSAYKSNHFNTAEFENEEFVNKETRGKIDINEDVFDVTKKPSDVITGVDCKDDAMNLYRNGYEQVLSTGIPKLDYHFKFKKGDLTLLSGIGNYGKSTFMKYILLIQILKNDKKIALFSPEETPAHEFFNDFVEMYFGRSIFGEDRPTEMQYEAIYDKLTKNIFFVYPETLSPTPDYVKEKFLELIIKEKVDFCVIDPFNQMTNDYGKQGRTDKYLETLLADFGRFAKDNSVYFLIIAHPRSLTKKSDGNYPCPDVYDIADGAMWNNKMDNILIYHIPNRQTDAQSTICELHSKKIRRRKIVGQIGSFEMEYFPKKRRFLIDGRDYLAELINEPQEENKLTFDKTINYYEPRHEQLDDTGQPLPF